MRPDVALIGPYPSTGEGRWVSGIASYTANLARGLVREGLAVEVVAPRLPGQALAFDDDGVVVHGSFDPGIGGLSTAVRAAKGLAPRVVHLQFEMRAYGGLAGAAGLLPALGRARKGAAALVATMHQPVDAAVVDSAHLDWIRPVPPVIARMGVAGIQEAISRTASVTIVHEEPSRRMMPRARLIPHGVTASTTGDRLAARRQFGIGADEFVVLCFGWLSPAKNLELLLDAAELAGPQVSVVIAGADYPMLRGSIGYGEKLRDRYAGATRFTGWVPDRQVPGWFAAADLAVFPYPRPFAASGGLALALAHGTPALLSPALARCAGAPSLMAAPLDRGALARRMTELAHDSIALGELRRWTNILARERHWETISRRHRLLYQEVQGG